MDQPNITLEDLTMTVQIIDTCASRGAFNGEEMELTGALRRRIVEFLQYHEIGSEEEEELEQDLTPPVEITAEDNL